MSGRALVLVAAAAGATWWLTRPAAPAPAPVRPMRWYGPWKATLPDNIANPPPATGWPFVFRLPRSG